MWEFEQATSRAGVRNLITRRYPAYARVGEARSTLRAAVTWLEAQALFVAGAALVAAFSLSRIPEDLNQDGWLALIGGRYVAKYGIPHHDQLTVMAHGARWVDQQWLAQLGLYGLHQVGGLALYSIVYVGLTVAALGMAIAAGRALGASERHVIWVLPAAGFLYFAGSFQIRTQGFAYPLFVATVWLLATDARANSRKRVYLVLPILVLWGNLHGSVAVGVGIATLYGATLLIEDVGRGGWRDSLRRIRARTLVFLVAPALCLFVTPYGPTIVSYYRETLLNPAFGHLVTEWQPVTSVTALAIPFFVIAFGTIWLLGRTGRQTKPFDQLTLAVLAVGAVLAVRNITWFGLAVLVLLPPVITRLLPSQAPARRRPTLNLSFAAVSLAVLMISLVTVVAQPESWFMRNYDQRAARVAAAVVKQHPAALIYAGDRYSDWLMWQQPSLEGHLAYDIRFELLTPAQLNRIAGVTQIRGPHTPDLLAPYSVLVLDPTDPATTLELNRRGTRVVLRGRRVVVATTAAP